jgi:hypothetical protein
MNNVGSNGNYWASSLNSSNTINGYNMNFNSSDVNWQNNNNRYNGFSLRGVVGEHLLFAFNVVSLELATFFFVMYVRSI